jgi:hypothetical protein
MVVYSPICAVFIFAIGYMWGGMDARNSTKEILSRTPQNLSTSSSGASGFKLQVPVSDEGIPPKEIGIPASVIEPFYMVIDSRPGHLQIVKSDDQREMICPKPGEFLYENTHTFRPGTCFREEWQAEGVDVKRVIRVIENPLAEQNNKFRNQNSLIENNVFLKGSNYWENVDGAYNATDFTPFDH